MTTEEITIPSGKYDWLWAMHTLAPVQSGTHPSTTLVVMIHGFPGDSKSYGDIFGELAENFSRNGLDSVRFDMRGCGQSNLGATFFSIRTGGEDCVHVLRWAMQTGYKRFHFISEGLGAAILVTILSDTLQRVTGGAIMLWPILSTPGHFAPDENFGPDLKKELAALDLSAPLGRLRVPVMAIRGSLDERCVEADLDMLRTRLSGTKLDAVTFDGGSHGLKSRSERDVVQTQSLAFLKRSACP